MGKVYRFWMIVIGVIGGCSLLYAAVIVITLGFRMSYLYFWIGVSGLCVVLDLGIWIFTRNGRIPPKWIVIPVECLVLVFCLLFIIIEAIIVHGGHQKPEENADYLIVLGAKVNGNQPSLTLKQRIEAAARYLKRNPHTVVIASGGKGADEDISEAQCICEQLMALGIEPERILMEDRSTSTAENLEFSAIIIRENEEYEQKGIPETVVLTTTDFHMFRAMHLAKEQGYESVYGNPAPSAWWLIPTNYTREFLAVVKDVVICISPLIITGFVVR